MLSFLRGEADVLVSTSIIESGIDIPQANTLIVERADIFGLAQLYQIRGRVGPLARARLRLPAVPQRRRADGGGGQAPERAQRLHRARRRLQDRDARPRDPRRRQPARRRAVRPRRGARLRALHADARRGRARRWTGRRATTSPSRCASTSTSTPTCRPTTSPTSRRRSTCTAGSPARARSPSSALLRDELEDRFGPVPEPLENLIALQQARIKLGQAGARMVSFRGGRLAVTPIELDSDAGAARCASASRTPSTSPGAPRCRCRVPRRPEGSASRAVVRAADALLAVAAPVRGPDGSLTNRGYHDPLLSCPATSARWSLTTRTRTSSRGPARSSPSSASRACGGGGVPGNAVARSAIRPIKQRRPSTTG